LSELLKNNTSVLCGHSGVGKSSLINALFPQWKIRTGDVSGKSGKGRHITRLSEMFPIPSGGFIVDTPGIREMQPVVSPEELDSKFVEFLPYLGQCRFKGCTHRHEPNCAIIAAVDSEKITEKRYESYCALYESL
jgi:ribosome biogenesis GTPase